MTFIKAVFFDFDGVLIDSIESMRVSWETVKTEFKISTPFESYSAHIGKPFNSILGELSIEPRLWKDISKLYSNTSSRNSHLVRLMPYALDTINWIIDRRIKTGLVTSKNQQRTYELIHKFDLQFDIVVTPELTPRGKPFPEPLLYASRKLNTDPKSALFIGDMISDMEAAKAANLKYLHFNSGYQKQEFTQYGGTIESLVEIKEYIEHQGSDEITDS